MLSSAQHIRSRPSSVRERRSTAIAGIAVSRSAGKQSHDHHGVKGALHAAAAVVDDKQHQKKQSEDFSVFRHITLICALIRACEYVNIAV